MSTSVQPPAAASALPVARPERPREQDWSRALRLLEQARANGDEVLLVAHVQPDGDALGSALGLGIALRRWGARPSVSFGSRPFTVPTSLSFLPGQDLLVPPQRVPAEPALMVTLDTGSLDRLGTLAGAATRAGALLVVDHHVSNTRFGSDHLLDVRAASTTTVVAELVDRLGVALDADIATCLYTGLTTDTGSFRYSDTTPAVHAFAARLLSTGIRHDEIARSVWDTHSFAYVHLLGNLLSRAVLEPEHDLVWTWASRDDLSGAGVALDEVEGVIDVIRTTAEAEVAVVAKQDLDGSWKVSTRSKGGVDMGVVCTGLGGGGHRFAAGYTAHGPLPATLARLRTALAAAPRAAGRSPA